MYWSLENVPWTNLHDLNLDWIINTMKQTVEQWIAYRLEMDGKFADFTTQINSDFDEFTSGINEWKTLIESEFSDLQAYVQNYFDNLDLNESTRYVINQMIASGEFVEVLNPSIVSAVESWLAEHITPTTPAVDSSLTVAGAAADAKVTGDKITSLNTSMIPMTGSLTYSSIIPDNTDINTITTIGSYIVRNRTSAKTMPNLPSAIGGRLLVISKTSGTADTQVYLNTLDSLYIRSFTVNPEYYSNWQEITTGLTRQDISNIQSNITNLNNIATILNKWAKTGALAFDVIDNEYVNNIGNLLPYNGWNRTDYVNIEHAAKLYIKSTVASDYNKFYDENKAPISAYDDNLMFTINIGDNTVNVPVNAKYVVLSGESPYANNIEIYIEETHAENAVEHVINTYKENKLGKYFLYLKPIDFTAKLKINDGNETPDAHYALSDYINVLNTQNKFIVNMPPNYGIYINQYTQAENDTFNFLAKSPYLQNNGEWWATTGTSHIRIEFYSSIITENIISKFCATFSLKESNDINSYLKICTFNQAANYPHFMNATEENLNKRILNYLNFLGEYNPDIICAQEAVGTYFQPVSFEKSVAKVFDRKYLFVWQAGYQRKTWSKYNSIRQSTVTFQSQADDDSRFYSKQTILYENKEIVVLNAHCAYQGNSDFNLARKGQFEELAAEMALHQYCICCGDFNAWSAEEFDVFQDFNLANCGDYGVIDTWYVGSDYPDWPFKAMDNIITTKNIVIQNVQKGPYDFNYFSDHAPLIVELQIR